MKKRFLKLFAVIVVFFTVPARAQEKIDLSEFFKVYFDTYNGNIFCFTAPDSLKNDSELKNYGISMWTYNMYLFENYSNTARQRRFLNTLLPDTIAIKHSFDSLIRNEIEFNGIFHQAYYRNKISSISIDSLSTIASRFFLILKMRGKVMKKICSVMNEVQMLEQHNNSPYYNAFCFMAIRLNEEAFNLFDQYSIPFNDEINGSDEISDERLEEIKFEIFEKISNSAQMREILISEYNRKKDYLNFELDYL